MSASQSPGDDLTDIDLLGRIAAGDEDALRHFYERHAPWLAVRLRRNLPVSAVEDVLQETFLAVWRGANRFQATGAVGAWVWGIARRQAAMWLRSHGRPETPFDQLPEAATTAPDPARQALHRIELELAFAASGAPGSASRDLARRVFIEDQSFQEIARDLDIPHGTVKSRVFAIRRAIRQAIDRSEES